MQRLFFAAIVLSMLATGPVRADGGRQNRAYRNSSGKGAFSRMVEMERAKNAWLRQKFTRR